MCTSCPKESEPHDQQVEKLYKITSEYMESMEFEVCMDILEDSIHLYEDLMNLPDLDSYYKEYMTSVYKALERDGRVKK